MGDENVHYTQPMDSGWCEADERIYQFRQNMNKMGFGDTGFHEAMSPFSVYQDADGRFHEDNSMPSYDFATPGNGAGFYATRDEAKKIGAALSTGKPIPEDVMERVAKRTVEANVAKMLENPFLQFTFGFYYGASGKDAERYLG